VHRPLSQNLHARTVVRNRELLRDRGPSPGVDCGHGSQAMSPNRRNFPARVIAIANPSRSHFSANGLSQARVANRNRMVFTANVRPKRASAT
jgi:hypothetical protein